MRIAYNNRLHGAWKKTHSPYDIRIVFSAYIALALQASARYFSRLLRSILIGAS